MNQTFDTGRWWLLVGKHWSENRKKYTLSLVAMAGLLLLWFSVILVSDRRSLITEIQINTYYFGLFVVGCLYASMLFADLGSKTRGLNYLVVPASHLEKLFAALFYSVIVFFVCYTAIFYSVDIIMVKIGNSLMYSHWLKTHTPGDVFVPQEVFNVFTSPELRRGEPGFIYYLLLFYFVLQSVFVLGSVYFAKFSFIKTVISALLVALVITFLTAKLIVPILPPGNYHNGINSYEVYTVKNTASGDGVMIYSDSTTDKLVSLPEWVNTVLLFLLKYAFAPLFWLATYYRLKEKEI